MSVCKLQEGHCGLRARRATAAASTVFVVGALGMACASAQPADKANASVEMVAGVRSIDREEAKQLRRRLAADAAPPLYVDRFLLADDAASEGGDEPLPDNQGFRSSVVETRLGMGTSSQTGFARSRSTEFGVHSEERLETLNFGSFLWQADGRYVTGDLQGPAASGLLGYARDNAGARVTFRNLGLPVDGRAFLDTAVGDLYTETTEGLGRSYRLSLGSTAIRGLSSRLYGSDFDLRAGVGERGYFAGGPYAGFEKSQGSLAWLGFTRRLPDDLSIAGQLDRAQDVPQRYASLFSYTGMGRQDVTSWALAMQRGRGLLQDDQTRWRLTWLGSQSTLSDDLGRRSDAQGIFLEASSRWGGARHEWGVYAARPDLQFGDTTLNTGSRGAFWRMDHAGSRLNWGTGFDLERSDASEARSIIPYTRASLSGNAQYQIDRNASAGGNITLYDSRDASTSEEALSRSSRSLYANAFYQAKLQNWGRSRFNAIFRRNEAIVIGDAAATGQELQWEHDWITGRYETLRPDFTTTLGYARDASGGEVRSYPTAGLQVRQWFGAGAFVGGAMRYTSQSGGLYTSRGLSGDLTAGMELGSGWRLGVSFNLNQARLAVQQTSLFSPQVSRSNEKSVYAFVRYETSRASTYRPVGSSNGLSGAGRIEGRVFYDADRDGLRQAGEAGVPNVRVLLDNAYVATTDADGRFEFSVVNTGRHQLTLAPESVPLPWEAAGEAFASVSVPLRGTSAVAIPVVRARHD